ncbi:MAG: OmpA family protein [Verrucomicrobiota bacterium]
MMGITSNLKSFKLRFKFFLKSRFYLFLFFICLFLSFIFHFVLLTNFTITSFNPSSFDRIIPRRVQLKRVDIDPTLLKEETKLASSLVPVGINISENEITTDQPSIVKDVKPSELKNEEFSEEKETYLLENQIILKMKTNFKQPLIDWDQLQGASKSSLKDIKIQETVSLGNYSKIEELLDQNSPLTSKTAPILLPTDLLFEYNVDQLKPDAEKSLEKLELLIQRNPKAQFIIEGFTDSFGSDEYNLDLSQRRAESIKKWLLSHQLIDGSKIQARGFGKKNFIVPSNGSIEQQRLNRRVEIVIHQN